MTIFEQSPVRALDDEFLKFFSLASTKLVSFHEELKDVINHEIQLCNDDWFGPNVNLKTKTIYLSMPFLDCYWCSFFALHILHEEIINFVLKNKNAQFFNMQATPFGSYYTFAINQFNEIMNKNTELSWATIPNLINSNFGNHLDDYLKEVNQVYVIGISSILLHECSHIYLGHHPAGLTKDEIREQEREADKNANSLLMEYFDDSDKEFTAAYGILLSYLSQLFLGKTNEIIDCGDHPKIQDRIQYLFGDFIEKSNIDENSIISLYHLCLQVFEMFLSQRGDSLKEYDVADVREAFYDNLDVLDKYIVNKK